MNLGCAVDDYVIAGIGHRIVLVDEDALSFSVEEDVRGFMEKGEPELVVCFVAERDLKDRLAWCQPSGGAGDVRVWQLAREGDRYAGAGTKLHELGVEAFGQRHAEAAHFLQGPAGTWLVVSKQGRRGIRGGVASALTQRADRMQHEFNDPTRQSF